MLPLEIDKTDKLKTLGILWDPALDSFSFKVQSPTESDFTKRKVASYAAKTYDPTGLIQPVIIKAKIILQKLWESKIGWDEIIPSQVKEDWFSYLSDLPSLERVQIPRHLYPNNPQVVNFHGFSDASSNGYGAVIYVQGISGSTITSHLLTSKSKVAPLRIVSIPRLELMGATLLSKLMSRVTESLRTQPNEIHYWSDSSIVLHQISKPSRNFKTFVGNRVAKIQEATDTSKWHYVNTKENPADLVSRGVTASELVDCGLWWHGPEWLATNQLPIGPIPGSSPQGDLEEVTSVTTLITTPNNSFVDERLSRFSSLIKIKRVTALTLRYLRRSESPIYTKFIPVPELNGAMEIWIRLIQSEHFSQEIKWLKVKKEFPNGNKLKPLTPFIDVNQILRVGGRLQEADNIPEEMRHPILLPKNHQIVRIIISDIHARYKHAGVQLMTSIIRSQYWILGLRSSLKRHIKNCITCRKISAEVGSQMMGNLPKFRITQSRPFQHTGVDYTGPIHVLPKLGRGQHVIKAWIAVFVCFSTKAIHLELVSGLSTDAFMAALKRFTSRRGKPQVLYSDEGTNFVGARNEMLAFQEEMEALVNNHEVATTLASDGIQWKLNPPGAPHMGGLWEAAVKSLKHHLKRAGDSSNFTLEEMTTLLCEIEACLNSMPLTWKKRPKGQKRQI